MVNTRKNIINLLFMTLLLSTIDCIIKISFGVDGLFFVHLSIEIFLIIFSIVLFLNRNTKINFYLFVAINYINLSLIFGSMGLSLIKNEINSLFVKTRIVFIAGYIFLLISIIIMEHLLVFKGQYVNSKKSAFIELLFVICIIFSVFMYFLNEIYYQNIPYNSNAKEMLMYSGIIFALSFMSLFGSKYILVWYYSIKVHNKFKYPICNCSLQMNDKNKDVGKLLINAKQKLAEMKKFKYYYYFTEIRASYVNGYIDELLNIDPENQDALDIKNEVEQDGHEAQTDQAEKDEQVEFNKFWHKLIKIAGLIIIVILLFVILKYLDIDCWWAR